MRAIAATPGKDLSHWGWHLSRDLDGLRQRRLERRVLLLLYRNVYPERDARVEHDIRQRVDDALLLGQCGTETQAVTAATSAATTAACSAGART